MLFISDKGQKVCQEVEDPSDAGPRVALQEGDRWLQRSRARGSHNSLAMPCSHCTITDKWLCVLTVFQDIPLDALGPDPNKKNYFFSNDVFIVSLHDLFAIF